MNQMIIWNRTLFHRTMAHFNRHTILYPAGLSLIYGSSTKQYVVALNEGRNDDGNKLWEKIQENVTGAGTMEIIEMLKDQVLSSGATGKLSYGAGVGFCSGFTLKKIGKIGAFIFGTGFCLFQTLSYNEYITINYDKVGKDLCELLDLNKDGQFNEADGKELYDKALEVVGFNMPAGSGFAAGFALGLRYG